MGADGSIYEQGSFEELASQAGFVSKAIAQPSLLDSGNSRLVEHDKCRGPSPKQLAGSSANDIVERTRQTGDLSVYKYYLAAIGWKLGVASAVASIVYVLAIRSPSKAALCDSAHDKSINRNSTVVELVCRRRRDHKECCYLWKCVHRHGCNCNFGCRVSAFVSLPITGMNFLTVP